MNSFYTSVKVEYHANENPLKQNLKTLVFLRPLSFYIAKFLYC